MEMSISACPLKRMPIPNLRLSSPRRRGLLFDQRGLVELGLRELLQLLDGVGDLGAVRRRELDHVVVGVAVPLLQDDVALVRDGNVDVGLSFDAHTRSLQKEESIVVRALERPWHAPGSRVEQAKRADVTPRLCAGEQSRPAGAPTMAGM